VDSETSELKLECSVEIKLIAAEWLYHLEEADKLGVPDATRFGWERRDLWKSLTFQ
jgi:hypothetical protein